MADHYRQVDLKLPTLALGGLIAGALSLFALLPAEKELDGRYPFEAVRADYYPGGAACRPPADRSPRRSSESVSAQTACQEAYEAHRLAQQNLIQQTRAAESAISLQRLAVNQSRSIAAATALGLLTLMAAAAAAYFAKQAADETRRSAEAAASTLRHMEQVSEEELRPYVFIGECKLTEPYSVTSDVLVKIHNFGKTPAESIRVGICSEVIRRPIGDHMLAREMGWSSIPSLGPGAEDCGRISMAELNEEDVSAIAAGTAAFVSLIRIEYKGRRGLETSQEIELYIDKDTLRHGNVHALTESGRSKEPET